MLRLDKIDDPRSEMTVEARAVETESYNNSYTSSLSPESKRGIYICMYICSTGHIYMYVYMQRTSSIPNKIQQQQTYPPQPNSTGNQYNKQVLQSTYIYAL